jgi:predicted site-specific integrase-resolvase
MSTQLLSRKELQERWGCSGETIKRRQRAGLLRPVYLSSRMVRYDLQNVLEIEAAAAGGAK